MAVDPSPDMVPCCGVFSSKLKYFSMSLSSDDLSSSLSSWNSSCTFSLLLTPPLPLLLLPRAASTECFILLLFLSLRRNCVKWSVVPLYFCCTVMHKLLRCFSDKFLIRWGLSFTWATIPTSNSSICQFSPLEVSINLQPISFANFLPAMSWGTEREKKMRIY